MARFRANSGNYIFRALEHHADRQEDRAMSLARSGSLCTIEEVYEAGMPAPLYDIRFVTDDYHFRAHEDELHPIGRQEE